MFKFLKEKIKDAVKSFSSNADVEEVEEEIIQEQVDSLASQEKKEQGEQAQKEAKQQVNQKEAKQKQQAESQKQEEQKTKLKEKQQEAKQQAKQKQEQEQKEQEAIRAQQKLDEEKQKQQETVALKESLETTSQSLEYVTDTAQESTSDSFSETTADAQLSAVDEYEQLEKKKGFFGRLFKKSEEPKEKTKIEAKEELFDELKKETKEETREEVKEEIKEIKEELASDVSTLAPHLEADKQVALSELAQEDVSSQKQSVANPETALRSTQRTIEQKKDAARADLFSTTATDATKQKKGFFSKIKERLIKFQLTEEKFEELFWEFELAMLENNVAVEVIEKIKQDMRNQLTTQQTTRSSIEDVILHTLQQSLSEILDVPTYDLIEKITTKKPFVICIVGVNGSGKTTTLAKLIALFQQQQLSMVVAAADTFRAAAIQQLEEHTTKLGVKLIKHDYHADPAAVAFDAIQHARAKQLDVVLIDTAGRLQSNSNLMDELRKVVRVNKPDLNLFIGESITGNDCVEQAVAFHEAVGIDGIILSKADIDEKGGAAISVSHVTGKPILYLGTGQSYGDLVPFDKEKILAQLGF